MRNIFRTPTGIECGSNWFPKLPNLVESRDAQAIQLALISKKQPSSFNFLSRLFYRLIGL